MARKFCVTLVCFACITCTDAFRSVPSDWLHGTSLHSLSKNGICALQVKARFRSQILPTKCVLSDGIERSAVEAQISEWKSFQAKNPKYLRGSSVVRGISSTLQLLLVQGLKSDSFDREDIEFLISLLAQANAPFDPRQLGDGPWQAVGDALSESLI
jgi:hypothetical protein